MFKNTLKGIEEVFDTDVAPGSIIMVVGPPGCMKTSLILTVMSRFIESEGKAGMYMSLEQTATSLERQMDSIGLKAPKGLYLYGYADSRELSADTGRDVDVLKLIRDTIETNHKRLGDSFSCFALDSLNAVYALAGSMTDLRIKVYHFLRTMRERNITTFIIMEVPRYGQIPSGVGNEAFLADGVIEMGFLELQNTTKLYMQVLKMRATRHSRDKFSLHVEQEDGGLMVTKEVFE